MDNQNTYILSLETKDIINAGIKGYKVSPKKKYKATMDFSLESLKLDEVAKEMGEEIFYLKDGKQYTDGIVSLSFDYAVKEFNQKSLDNEVVYIKHDWLQSLKSMVFVNGLYIVKDSIIAINVDELILTTKGELLDLLQDELQDMPNGFTYEIKGKNIMFFADTEKIRTIKSTASIREHLYVNGFNLIFNKKPVKYIRYKRSSGSSRIGKCLFIREDLYAQMMDWSMMGLLNEDREEYDMAGQEAYISLTSSSIIDTLQIDSRSILLLPDSKIPFKDTVMATTVIKDENGKDVLLTNMKENEEITNKIWDGQSLLCSTIFGNSPVQNLHWVNGKYHDKGYLLLRNRFFKSACFQCDIQQFFKDNGITSIDQIDGQTLANDIKEIQLITTPSSIKYLKYGTWEEFIKQCTSEFGIVKYEKPTHYFDGDLVQSHYQLINTLQLSSENIKALTQPSLDYIKLLKRDIRVLREHLGIKIKNSLKAGEINSTDDLMFAMLVLNNQVQNTDMFVEWRQDMIKNYIDNMKKGHILIPGTYAVICGNGMEMLKATIKDKSHVMAFNGTSLLKADEIHCSNFDFGENGNGKDLLACRSPHTAQGNLWLCKNVEYNLLDQYFYRSPQIIHGNSIDSNLMERLSSCDFDSDSLLLTDLKLLIDAATKNYKDFLVPTSKVEAKLVKRANTQEQKAKLDTQTSINKIGEIVNLSQLLVTKLWDTVKDKDVADESVKDYVNDLYKDICQLSVMSTLEIDKAKRETRIDITKEMEKIKARWIEKILTIEPITERVKRDGKKLKEKKQVYDEAPKEIIAKYNAIKGSDNPVEIEELDELLKTYILKSIRPVFFKVVGEGQKYCFIHQDCPMDYLQETITSGMKHIKAQRRQGDNRVVTLGELFGKEIKVGDAAYDQAKKIILECKDLKEKTNFIWNKESIDGEEKYVQANQLKNDFIERVKGWEVSASTIKKIIYDLNKESIKVQKGRNGEKDKEVNKEISKFGRKLLSVLYKAHTDKFMEIFQESKEKVESITRFRGEVKGKDTINVINLYGIPYIVRKS